MMIVINMKMIVMIMMKIVIKMKMIMMMTVKRLTYKEHLTVSLYLSHLQYCWKPHSHMIQCQWR